MKILAVADVPSLSLETQVETSPERYRSIDCIVSCGDLDREYLEYLVDNLKKPLFFILGNHQFESSQYSESGSLEYNYYAGGGTDLHGRVEEFGNYLMVGFGGSMWYNGKPNQYTESEMSRVIKQVERKILWIHLQDKMLGRKAKDVIVISHAPPANVHDQPDIPHRGFKCFHHFIKRINPLIWMHGHIHMVDAFKNQVTLLEQTTTVINVFSCKVVEIADRHIDVHSHCIV
ncbi:MAG: metallophosphoesterase [Endomicrobiales bacterium]|jgi:Icc-related predicted phosphoesterase